jgi:hypothetical protein
VGLEALHLINANGDDGGENGGGPSSAPRRHELRARALPGGLRQIDTVYL